MNTQYKLKKVIIGVLDDKYYLYEELGVGASCIAYLASPINDEYKKFAVKVIINENVRHNPFSCFEREIKALSQLSDNNNEASKNIIYMENYKSNAILKLFNSSQDKSQEKHNDMSENIYQEDPHDEHQEEVLETVDYICLGLAEKGELFDYLKYYSKGFTEDIARFLFTQILNGVNYCHQIGFVHRDLKLDNILFDSNWIIKISDFGLSATKMGSNNDYCHSSIVGTNSYMAPEIAIGSKLLKLGRESRIKYYGEPADVFSLGVILFIMVVGIPPFLTAVKTNDHSSFNYLVNKDHKNFWKEYEKNDKTLDLSDEFKSLIVLMLSVNPFERPSIAKIFDHTWMKLSTPPKKVVDQELNDREIIIKIAKKLESEKIKKQKEMEEQEVLDKTLLKRKRKTVIVFENPYFNLPDEVKELVKNKKKT